MGLLDRLRKQRIIAGLEQPIRHEKARNLIVETIKRQDTDTQVGILSEALDDGRLQNSRLRKSLEGNAPKEMRKGIEKLAKKGLTPTVDLLLDEYRNNRSFQKLANSVGLNEIWFIKLAEDCLKELGYAD